MRKYSLTPFFIMLSLFSLFMSGCKKFLEEKPTQSLTVPSNVQDVQMLLDDRLRINQRNPSAGIISADEYYMLENDWNSMDPELRDMYTWQPENLFPPGAHNDWGAPYNNIYIANVVLDHLQRIPRTETNKLAWDNAKGHALFVRATMFYYLSTLFAKAYDESTASTDLCVPLRTDPDFNMVSIRATVEQCFQQVLQDLKMASSLLPINPVHVVRPSRPAAHGMLARVYLYMRKYDHAYLYADSCLQVKSNLINYNQPIPGFYNPAANLSFSPYHPEVVNSSNIGYPYPVYLGYVDSNLYKLYHTNDLRKTVFFRAGQVQYFKGNYEGQTNLFDGIATDEMFLVRAECAARKGFKDDALQDLNHLLMNRFKTGTFVPYTAATANDALQLILTERRKELVFRGLRFTDIKRLNKEGAGIVQTRTINNQTYTLAANDLRYALPLPKDVLELTGMPNNPR
jgi:hypothetical protein